MNPRPLDPQSSALPNCATARGSAVYHQPVPEGYRMTDASAWRRHRNGVLQPASWRCWLPAAAVVAQMPVAAREDRNRPNGGPDEPARLEGRRCRPSTVATVARSHRDPDGRRYDRTGRTLSTTFLACPCYFVITHACWRACYRRIETAVDPFLNRAGQTPILATTGGADSRHLTSSSGS